MELAYKAALMIRQRYVLYKYSPSLIPLDRVEMPALCPGFDEKVQRRRASG